MKRLTEDALIAAGYTGVDQRSAMLARAAELERRGITEAKYALKLLRREFGPPPPKVALRELAVPLTEAIEVEGKDGHENLYAVRRHMSEILRSPVIVRGTIMPDACPTGGSTAAMPVGGAIVAENAIIPSAHSADVCCSMFATFYEARSSVASELDVLTGATRFGPGHRHLDDVVEDPVLDEEVWSNPFLTGLRERARLQMADQGDGNHFAYLGVIDITPAMVAILRLTAHTELAQTLASHVGKALRVLVTHHGSRSLGAHLFKRGQIAAMKHTTKLAGRLPEAAAWLDARSGDGPAYWEALQYVALWTKANHRSIHQRFLTSLGGQAVAEMGNEHNFVWQRGDLFFHGKGATPAWRDPDGRPLLGLIPLNMAEPILITLGADNTDFLSFAPHGAGRNISRTALRRRFPGSAAEDEIVRAIDGLDVRWFCGRPDISETPVAYKNAQQVKAQIARFGLAEVIGEIRPLGCIMAGVTSWRDRDEELTPKQLRQIDHRAQRRKTRSSLRGEI